MPSTVYTDLTRCQRCEIDSYCYSAYTQPLKLFFGEHIIQSQEGPQPKDPLGPLLFCNTLHPWLQSLTSELNLGYLTLGGLQSEVAKDVYIQAFIENIGLHLNVSKCELICSPDLDVDDDLYSAPTNGGGMFIGYTFISGSNDG